MKSFIHTAWAHLKKWWGLIAAATGAAVVAWIAVGAYQRRVGGVRDALRIERVRAEIAELRGRRDELNTQNAADEAEVQQIDRELAANKLSLSQLRLRAEVTPAEIEEELRQLGY